ncbi:O-antigen ligase family protein [Bacillus sp. LL01]|uniref:O-antigen ligase family protein n=1 Tax=Bacillus sp. LL01 TaxID=1665556 RepID=UPI0012FEC0D1|nr:O-antigen ligase family protein [Bacillus sp. LL01]
MLFIINSWDLARTSGFIGNPNYYAVTLLVCIGFILSLFYTSQVKSKFYYLANTLVIIDLMLTFSRGAILALFIMVVVYFLIYLRPRIKKGWIIKSLLIMPFIIYVLLKVMKTNLFERIYNNFAFRVEDALEGSGASRYIIWEDALNLFYSSNSYILFGVGGNNFIAMHEHNLHNNYLKALIESGMIGFMFLIIFLVVLILKTINVKNLKVNSPFFFILIGFLVFSLSNDMFIVHEFWVIVALISTWKIKCDLKDKLN